MTAPRANQISLLDTKYYHCMTRCVRQSFLCGEDYDTGRSFEHRRQWIEDKLHCLTDIFCIDICAYAVMSNHYHVIFHVDDEKAKKLSDDEVIRRWTKLFKGSLFVQKYLAEETLDEAQMLALKLTIKEYRQRLFSISWFMKVMNESIARRANKEDGCSGYFWSGRYKSQALLDEAALATCMAYVDLNPVRATMAKTLETSEHTSIKKRIVAAKKGEQPKTLMPFVGNDKQAIPKGVPFHLADYLKLVELTGRCIRQDKRGYLADDEPILCQLSIESESWLKLAGNFSRIFQGAVGREHMLDPYCAHLGRLRRINLTSSRQYFN